MSKMGLHDPFEYLKHKLWLKEGLGIKVSIWLLTIKSQELLWITCLQMVCKCCFTYFWKALNKGYNFALDLASIGGLHKKLWASKIVEVLILRISRFLTWEFWEKWHLVQPPWPVIENIIREKVVASPPSPGHDELMSLCMSMARLCTKNVPIMH